eukprot:6472296-Amphidinium_carterae.1
MKQLLTGGDKSLEASPLYNGAPARSLSRILPKPQAPPQSSTTSAQKYLPAPPKYSPNNNYYGTVWLRESDGRAHLHHSYSLLDEYNAHQIVCV